MTWEATREAEREARRFLKRLDELKKKSDATGTRTGSVWSSKESGAVRRASMDLTRALADLRRWS